MQGEISLVGQWFGLHTSTAGVRVQSRVGGLGSPTLCSTAQKKTKVIQGELHISHHAPQNPAVVHGTDSETQLPTAPGSGWHRDHTLSLSPGWRRSFNAKSRSEYHLSLAWPHSSGLGLWSHLLPQQPTQPGPMKQRGPLAADTHVSDLGRHSVTLLLGGCQPVQV